MFSSQCAASINFLSKGQRIGCSMMLSKFTTGEGECVAETGAGRENRGETGEVGVLLGGEVAGAGVGGSGLDDLDVFERLRLKVSPISGRKFMSDNFFFTYLLSSAKLSGELLPRALTGGVFLVL